MNSLNRQDHCKFVVKLNFHNCKFLYLGHLIGPVVCHMFCNFMGFPDFAGIMQFSIWKGNNLLFLSWKKLMSMSIVVLQLPR